VLELRRCFVCVCGGRLSTSIKSASKSMHHPPGEGRGRGVPRLSENIQVTEVFVLKYECMGALKECHWDAKGNTYGSRLIRIGEGDYIGGDTFMDHGRACFLLLKHEAVVWTTYDGHGQLLGATVHAAGTACGGAKLVVAALWRIKGILVKLESPRLRQAGRPPVLGVSFAKICSMWVSMQHSVHTWHCIATVLHVRGRRGRGLACGVPVRLPVGLPLPPALVASPNWTRAPPCVNTGALSSSAPASCSSPDSSDSARGTCGTCPPTHTLPAGPRSTAPKGAREGPGPLFTGDRRQPINEELLGATYRGGSARHCSEMVHCVVLQRHPTPGSARAPGGACAPVTRG
jgi:hypothetical protein